MKVTITIDTDAGYIENWADVEKAVSGVATEESAYPLLPGDHGHLHDSSGNICGEWDITPDIRRLQKLVLSEMTGKECRSDVLNRIQEFPLKPTELLAADLGAKYSYAQIQNAVTDLLEKGDVVLTPDLLLKPRAL